MSTPQAGASQEGVTESVEAPINAAEDSPPEEKSGEQQAPESQAGAPVKTQNRYQKLANENREFKKQIDEYQKYNEAIEFHKWLQTNQQAGKAIHAVANAIANNQDPHQALSALLPPVQAAPKKEPAQDPKAMESELEKFKDYPPEAQELAKRAFFAEQTAREFLEWKAQVIKDNESYFANQKQTQMEANMGVVDSEFDQMLFDDGFINEQGEGDPDELELIENAVLSQLAKTTPHHDPRLATKQEVKAAYEFVTKKGLAAYSKRALKSATAPAVPPSGSRYGKTPIGTVKKEPWQVIADSI